MKSTLFTLAIRLMGLTLLAASPQLVKAQEEVNFDFFYQGLSAQGDWYNTPEYGYVWQPYVGCSNDQWRPYTDGYWAQTDQGWTWVSYENFGWATYHYGRWMRYKNTGWVWVPGYEWGPGWVSWRTNDQYIGWAPIPPKRYWAHTRGSMEVGPADVIYNPPPSAVSTLTYDDLEGNYNVGYNGAIDENFDIGPGYYNFVPVANFSAVYVAPFIIPRAQNITYVQQTVNVTNIVYQNIGGTQVIYNGGPDYGFLRGRVHRPIPRLYLNRQTHFAGGRIAPGSLYNRVNGNRMDVIAPRIARGPVNLNQIKPTRVTKRLIQPEAQLGWSEVAKANPNALKSLRQQYKQDAAKAPPAAQTAKHRIQNAPIDIRKQIEIPKNQGGRVPKGPQGQPIRPPGDQIRPHGQAVRPQVPPIGPQGQPIRPSGDQIRPHGPAVRPQVPRVRPPVQPVHPQGGQVRPYRPPIHPQGQPIYPQGGQVRPHGQPAHLQRQHPHPEGQPHPNKKEREPGRQHR